MRRDSGWIPSESSSSVGRSSGPGMPSGIGTACSIPGFSSWNEAIIEKIGTPFWKAWQRRVENERPSWIRSTANVSPCEASPARRK